MAEQSMVDSLAAHVWIVTIHDRTVRGFVALDIKDILSCLDVSALRYMWIVTQLECTGPEAQSLSDAVEKHGSSGVVLSGDQLWAASQKLGQTIEATVVGTPLKDYSPEELIQIADWSRFPESHARLVIRAIDSSFFEVIAKDPHYIELLKRRFQDVQDEDVSQYFPVIGKS
jgi:hypothetical protein